MSNANETSPLLEVKNLSTVFHFLDGAYMAVDGVSFALEEGEVLGLVGESGSGKSVTGFSLLGLVDPPGEVVDGTIMFQGQNLRDLPQTELRRIRGNAISMIFQDPLTTLNPVLTIEEQMSEAISEHHQVKQSEIRRRIIEALTQVGITSPDTRIHQYPHELSGGMRQRVAIAIAILNKPKLIIADEPTTALDVTIQGQILAQMQSLRDETGTALMWITHDLGVVSELADKVAVMYAGRIVEMGPIDAVLDSPRHPYTLGLLQSIPGDTPPGNHLKQILGNAPALSARPSGCAFHPRCGRASPQCSSEEPAPNEDANGHIWLCHHAIGMEQSP